MKALKWLAARAGHLVLLVAVTAAGFVARGCLAPPQLAEVADMHGTSQQTVSQEWTCSMHPQIRQDEPGACPLCGMDLIPVATEDAGAGASPRTFTTSEASKALMDIQTSVVERRFGTAEVRMVGKVEFDETRLGYITAWVPGRIERMYANYTGIVVIKGDHMADLYSPEVLTAQQELHLSAQAAVNAPAVLKKSTAATLEATRAKLQRWGLTERQIAKAEKEGIVSDRITIYAPMGGTVIQREGQEGDYVKVGTRIYTIADLSAVWVKLDAYESDLAWLHYGQAVEFALEAYPGEVFEGKIAFIEPILDAASRTVKVRVNLPNTDGRLKPGMFVRGIVRAQIATRGRVMDPGLAGKWMCPMHPEIIKDGPASCDLCGMPVVQAEKLGYVAAMVSDDDKPLVIPATAPLLTGKRAVVYVALDDVDRPTFEGREIVLGPRAGDYYLVESGLEEGERVVTNGNFKIDSSLQLLAKPSMMTPDDDVDGMDIEVVGFDGVPDAFEVQLGTVFDAYLNIQSALANDNFEAAVEATADLSVVLTGVDMALLKGDAHMAWMDALTALKKGIEATADGKEIEVTRIGFGSLSNALIKAIQQFGIGPDATAYIVHCPMAFDGTGADWLQADPDVLNPYFGESMLKCGEVMETIAGGSEESVDE